MSSPIIRVILLQMHKQQGDAHLANTCTNDTFWYTHILSQIMLFFFFLNRIDTE